MICLGEFAFDFCPAVAAEAFALGSGWACSCELWACLTALWPYSPAQKSWGLWRCCHAFPGQPCRGKLLKSAVLGLKPRDLLLSPSFFCLLMCCSDIRACGCTLSDAEGTHRPTWPHSALWWARGWPVVPRVGYLQWGGLSQGKADGHS